MGRCKATQIRQVIEKHLWLSVFYISSVRDHPNRECIKLFEYPVSECQKYLSSDEFFLRKNSYTRWNISVCLWRLKIKTNKSEKGRDLEKNLTTMKTGKNRVAPDRRVGQMSSLFYREKNRECGSREKGMSSGIQLLRLESLGRKCR